MEDSHLFHSRSAHDFQSSVQNENAGPFVKHLLRFQEDNRRALNQAGGPSKCRALCDCTSHSPMKAALIPFFTKPNYFT